MKRKDIALIIAVAGISAVAAFVVSGTFITSPKNRNTKVEVVDAITDEFKVPPNSKYFNPNSINPTQVIHIGDQSNSNPFAGQ